MNNHWRREVQISNNKFQCCYCWLKWNLSFLRSLQELWTAMVVVGAVGIYLSTELGRAAVSNCGLSFYISGSPEVPLGYRSIYLSTCSCRLTSGFRTFYYILLLFHQTFFVGSIASRSRCAYEREFRINETVRLEFNYRSAGIKLSPSILLPTCEWLFFITHSLTLAICCHNYS